MFLEEEETLDFISFNHIVFNFFYYEIIFFRYRNPFERMISGSHQRSQELEESAVGRPERSAPSANSQKILWDGLTDFERIKRKEIQVIICSSCYFTLKSET